MALRIVGPIEALSNFWGRRHFLRRTLNAPARNRAMVKLMAITADAAILAKMKNNPKLLMPEAMALAQWLADGYAGEAGWDTAQALKGIEGATAVRQNDMAKADPMEI